MTYSEKLKDPRWNYRRLEILKRDNYQCQKCKTIERPLHVHHIAYLRNKEPWEYEDKYLISLCEDCHGHESAMIKDISYELLQVLKEKGYLVDEIMYLTCLIDWLSKEEMLCSLIELYTKKRKS